MRALASTALLLFAGALSACSEHSAPERGPLHLASDSVDVASLGDTVRLVAMLGGTTLNANDQGLEWHSLDPATASVAFDGLVLARAEGRARIVVTRDRATDTAIVRVRQIPAEFSTAWQDDTLFVDDTLRMGLRMRDAKGNPIVPSPDELTITTTVPGVVSIDSAGLVTARAGGGTGLGG